jgi:hypothetical protein
MSSTSRNSAPAGLAARGRAFWRATVVDYELSSHEMLILLEVCRTIDEIDVLRAALATDGATVPGSKKQPRSHPAFGELRAARTSLARLIKTLDLPVPQEDGKDARRDATPDRTDRRSPHPAVTAKARRAANRRWHPHVLDTEGAG